MNLADPTLSAWSDPRFMGAVFIVSAVVFGLTVLLGIPHMIERKESRPLILGFLATGAMVMSVSLARSDEIHSGEWLTDLVEGVRKKPPHSDEARSAGESFATAAAPFLGDIDPKAYGDIGTIIIGSSRLLVLLNEKMPPVLERTESALARMETTFKLMDPMLTAATPAMQGMPPFLKEAQPVFRDMGPFLRDMVTVLNEAMPLLQDSKKLTSSLVPVMEQAEVILGEIKKRDPGKMADKSLRLMDKVDGTLTDADVVLENLQFMDENWLRHFLQVEGVQAYAGVGSPDIPKGSKPVEPPPIRKK